MIKLIDVQLIRGMVKNHCSDKEIKDYIDRCIRFNARRSGKGLESLRFKRIGDDEWIVTTLEE